MPIGYLITVAVVALGMLLALRPVHRPAPLRTASWVLGSIVNESPFVAFYWVLAATLLALAEGDLETSVGWVGLGIACVTLLGTPVLVRRSLAARPVVEQALDEGLGPEWRGAIDPTLASRFRGSLPWVRILLAPVPVLHRGVKQVRNLSYGDAGRRNRLDVYHHPARPAGAPILIHLHGGGFRVGRKSLYSRALLAELARHGWVCISASYRLRPRAVFPDYLVDAKKVIAWARRHGEEYGADPSVVFIAGSSAGAHLAVTAALTPNDGGFQPGFEEADTTVSGAICLFGYYGPVDRGRQPLPSSPLVWRNDPAAFSSFPDFFLAHELAHQWWGQAIGWRNYHEQWLSEGFAQYFAALYAQKQKGDDVFASVLRQLRKWGMDNSDQGPVYLGYRLGHVRDQSRIFRALVYNKGAAVLHMLRRLVGDEPFFRGLRHFYSASRFHKAGTAELRAAMEAETGMSLERFFERWIYGSTLPKLKVGYRTEGNEVILQVEQIGEIFDVPLTIELQYADRKPVEVLMAVTDRTVEKRVPLGGVLRGIDVSKDDGTMAEIVKN